MAKVIIGIHGLANKPVKEVLASWWSKSLLEGLMHNCGVRDPQLTFEMVYWADLLHFNPAHRELGFEFDVLYNHQPYYPADPQNLKTHRDGLLDSVRAAVSDWVGAGVDGLKQAFGMDTLADWFLARLLKDLAFYYDDNRKIRNRKKNMEQARKVLRDELKAALLTHADDEIMIIAHSMGTIISYDVLRDLGQERPDMKIARFVTIGSPLGLPHVKHKIIAERDYDPRVRTPSIVTGGWANFADPRDPVALDTHLHDDYQANANGVRVRDDLIHNDYVVPLSNPTDPNPHKSYGYLRTPEVSEYVHKFLNESD